MEREKLWRGSVLIREQSNGYYSATVHERWEGEAHADPSEYKNLSWAELEDVVSGTVFYFDESRKKEHRQILEPMWNQTSLFD